jgi:hypothetical protein
MLRPRLVAAAIALATFAAPAPAGEPYRDRDHQFRLTMPDRWDTTNPSAVTALSSNVLKYAGQNINYTACFVQRGKTSTDLPRILVQWLEWPEPPPNYEVLHEGLSRELAGAARQAESNLPVKLNGLEIGGHYLDREKNRVVIRMRVGVPGVGTVEAVSYGMLGQKGTAILHCYALRDKFEATLPLFVRVADSFRYDDGWAYKPDPNARPGAGSSFSFGLSGSSGSSEPSWSSDSSDSSFNWDGASNGGVRGGMIGGVIGIFAVAGRWLRRRGLR